MKLALKDIYSDIGDFDYNMYAQPNEWGCSKCGTPLDGPVHVVSKEDDEEGYEWRIFCPKCWKKAEESPFTITDLYEMYKPAPYLGEDDYR